MKALMLSAVLAGMTTLSSAWAAPLALNDAQLDSVSAGSLVNVNVNVPINVNTTVQNVAAVALAGSIGATATAAAHGLNVNLSTLVNMP